MACAARNDGSQIAIYWLRIGAGVPIEKPGRESGCRQIPRHETGERGFAGHRCLDERIECHRRQVCTNADRYGCTNWCGAETSGLLLTVHAPSCAGA